MFFNEAALDFNEGYKILMDGTPRLENIDKQTESRPNNAEFLRRLLLIMRKDAIAESEWHDYASCFLSQNILSDTTITFIQDLLLSPRMSTVACYAGEGKARSTLSKKYTMCVGSNVIHLHHILTLINLSSFSK